MSSTLTHPSEPSRGSRGSAAQRRRSAGFSLIELAIGLVIVATLLSALLVPLGAQVEQQRSAETLRRLDAARDALLGFAVSNGRLPCPASATTNGRESFSATPGTPANGECELLSGWLPGVTLGLSNLDDEGFYLDGYALGVASRIRYAVAQPSSLVSIPDRAFTKADGVRGIDATATRTNMRAIASANTLLTVCSSASTSGTGCSSSSPIVALANGNAVAVLFSTGPKATTRAPSPDELENSEFGTDKVFVSRVHGEVAGNEFDDQVLWISPSVLFYRMTSGGALP